MNGRITAALLALSACGRVEATDEGEVVAGREALRDCAGGASSDGIIIGNSLGTSALIYNTLLMDPASNQALSHAPLNTRSFDTIAPLHEALYMPESVEVMEYLVGCALASQSAPVKWKDGPTAYLFRGEIGLCPDWERSPPTQQCLEAVSACILARNNHIGVRVPLSLRGDDSRYGTCVTPSNRLRPWAEQPSLSSYTPCGGYAVGPRDCGWRSEGVWQCTPGSSVYFQTDPRGGGLPSSTRMLRACDGISACDRAAELSSSSPHGGVTTVSMSCPPSGRLSLMSAPYDASFDVAEPVRGKNAGLLDERELFKIREGAFYGTMFGPGAIAFTVTRQGAGYTPPPWLVGGPKVIFPKMNACSDAAWTEPVARMVGYAGFGRVCVFGHCASEYTGVCQREGEATCGTDPYEPAEETEMRECKDRSGNLWTMPLTSYLERPCALTDPQFPKLCDRK